MNDSNLVAMVINLSRSFLAVQQLISGLAYLLGILLIVRAIMKLKKIGDARTGSSSQEKAFVPLAFLVGGAGLIFLPTMVSVLSNTTFGSGNVLQYTPYATYSIYGAMTVLIKTAGLIWFIRGTSLLVHASEPGQQDGPKGLAFLFGGVLAMNFESSIGILQYMFDQLIALSNMRPGQR
jgi:hypothetical protein